MADRRNNNESCFGHPGRLTYFTHGIAGTEEGGWKTGRNHDKHVPRIKEVTAGSEWFAAARGPDYAPSGHSWHDTQRQKRWLLKNHPSAALGNDMLGELLSEATSPYRYGQITPWELTQLAVGEMTDRTNAQKVCGAPLLAMATGAAGDVLRLVRPQVEAWTLGNEQSAPMHLLGGEDCEETLWTGETGTIRRVSTIVSTRRFEPVRCLAVQTDLGTAFFQPEYRITPVAFESPSATASEKPSHIAPNLLFSIQKDQTGFNYHSDCSYNPAVRSHPAQLAIVDEGGNWTVWDITGQHRAHKRPKPCLVHSGSVEEAGKTKAPGELALGVQRHQISWIGSSTNAADEFDDSGDETTAESQHTRAYPPLSRSTMLLISNAKMVKIMDLESGTFLPDLGFIAEGCNETVLDVHVNAQDPRYFYVLTTAKLCVAMILPATDGLQERPEKRAVIIYATPHLRDKHWQNLKIAVTPGARSATVYNSLVFLYSRGSNWIDVIAVSISKKQPERVVTYRDSVVLDRKFDDDAEQDIQTLCLLPAAKAPRPQSTTSPLQIHQGVQVHQLFLFQADLSLSSSLLTSSTGDLNHSLTRNEPNVKDKKTAAARQRRRMIRHLSARFVVSDSVAGVQDGSGISQGAEDSRTRDIRLGRTIRRRVRPLYEYIQTAYEGMIDLMHMTPLEMATYSAAPFDPVFGALEAETLELKTFLEMMQQVKVPGDIEEASRDWHDGIDDFPLVDPNLKVMSLVDAQSAIPGNLRLVDIFSQLQDLAEAGHLGFASEDQAGLSAFIRRRIACELYFSRFGLMHWPSEVLDPRPPRNRRASNAEFSDLMDIDSQPMSSQPGSSRPSTPTESIASSFAPADTAGEKEDRALAVLGAYMGSAAGQGVPTKKLEVTALWPEGQGADEIDEYVFSIDRQVEVTEGMRKKARRLEREARKRKREETIQQRLSQRELASTQPAAAASTRFQTQSSQPMGELSQTRRSGPSSLVPKVAMSQPVAGAFANRSAPGRPKKRMKRKGGF